MRYLITLAMLLCLAGPVLALDTSYDTSKDTRVDQEVNRLWKKSIEKKNTTGTKTADNTTTGRDRQDSETVRSIGEARRSATADVTLPLEAVFMSALADLEVSTEPFSICKIATDPKLGRDFGLSAEIEPGVIDSVKSSYLTEAAASNMAVATVADEVSIRQYRDCMAAYGALIGQAHLYLANDLAEIQGRVRKDKQGNIEVDDMGYDDFADLARSALMQAIQIITDKTIAGLLHLAVNDQTPCRFDRSPETIKCGPSLMVLGTKPQLYVSGIQFYGERFAGYAGSYRVSRDWSYASALEKLKSTSRYSKFASEVSKYADDLEARGRVKEASFARKTAVNLVKKSEQKASPNKHVPSVE